MVSFRLVRPELVTPAFYLFIKIIWLCRSHHLRLHARFRELSNRDTYAYL